MASVNYDTFVNIHPDGALFVCWPRNSTGLAIAGHTLCRRLDVAVVSAFGRFDEDDLYIAVALPFAFASALYTYQVWSDP